MRITTVQSTRITNYALLFAGGLYRCFIVEPLYTPIFIVLPPLGVYATMPGNTPGNTPSNTRLPTPTVATACTCQKHVTNVSQHGSMGKSDGAMRSSLSCQKVMDYSESAKTLY